MHRQALQPLLSEWLPDASDFESASSAGDFGRFLTRHHLQTLWLDLLGAGGNPSRFATLEQTLREGAKMWAALELSQRNVMHQAHSLLETAGIPYFFAKGVHLQQVLYDRPSQRASSDIDIFIRRSDRRVALRGFLQSGFDARPLADTISHELRLRRHNSDVDLHWDLFRPGRANPQIMDWLFGRRERFGEYWGLDATASLLVMLVHPAITKYLLSPASMLIHLVDQVRLMRGGRVDWAELTDGLTRSDTRTAAWSSLYVLRLLTGTEAPQEFERSLRPGRLTRWYLRQWIDRAWITRWFERRRLVAGLFSLALQDSWADRLRAVRSLRAAGRDAPALMEEVQQLS
jgi:hypothetical protein